MVKKKKKGFTLIELVAVIAILGILAIAIVPQVSKYIEKSKKTAVQAQCREIVTAFEAYKDDVQHTDMHLEHILNKDNKEFNKIQELLGNDLTRFNRIDSRADYYAILAISRGSDFTIDKGKLNEVITKKGAKIKAEDFKEANLDD